MGKYTAPGGSGGDVVDDTSPELGGNLVLNSNNITGTGEISITGGAVLSGDLVVDTDTLFVDVSEDKVGIGTTSPATTLDVVTGSAFRSTRLLTVALSSSTTLSEASHAGRYVFVTGSSTVITLPDNQGAGTHFTLVSNDTNGFTLRTGTSGSTGDNMNGSQADITVDARNGVTCISTGTDYVVLGA